MLKLLEDLSENQADTFGLVLASCGISHRVKEGEDGWELWVDDGCYREAQKAIGQYLKENREFHRTPPSVSYTYRKTFTGLWVSAALLACHVAVAASSNHQAFIKAFGSSAFHVLHGEWYRTVTSLMLHANALHLLGNMVGIALFGCAVCGITDFGLGWLMILASGVIGNLCNAFLYRTGHLAVGASTAVFGAIGILVAIQFLQKFRIRGQRIRAWVPLGGGLALLGILGSGAHVDLMAHLFGFVAGIGFGSLYGLLFKQPPRRAYQVFYLFVALGLLGVSWMEAFNQG